MNTLSVSVRIRKAQSDPQDPFEWYSPDAWKMVQDPFRNVALTLTLGVFIPLTGLFGPFLSKLNGQWWSIIKTRFHAFVIGPTKGNMTFYRPQWSCGKVMFLHLSISHSVHRGCLPPPYRQTPPWADTPWADTPLPSACLDTLLCPVHAGIHTPTSAVHEIRSRSRRYASYWNAYLLSEIFRGNYHGNTIKILQVGNG